MTKSDIIDELDLCIDKATFLYGSISINDPVKEIIEILVNIRRRVNLEGVDE